MEFIKKCDATNPRMVFLWRMIGADGLPRRHEFANIFLWGLIGADGLPRRHEGAKKHEGLVRMIVFWFVVCGFWFWFVVLVCVPTNQLIKK